MPSRKKVIVIGLDGLEPGIVETMLERSELPNMAKIRSHGSYSRLATTYPAQTPVAWSTFATGTNPGGHGIFDFISRDPQTYFPDAALSRFEAPKNIFSPPRVVNQRKGVPVWQTLSLEGVPSVILRCPCTFPPDALQGKLISGVGVPDIRGSQSKGTFYTQDRTTKPQEHEQLIYVDAGTNFKTQVIGPRNTKQFPAGDAVCEILVQVDKESRKVRIETGGSPAQIEVAEHCWSEWVRFKFKLSMLQSVSGIARLYVRGLEPHVEFYVSAVNFDPAAPMFPISAPAEYAKEAAEQIGLFSTLGMAEEHNGLNNGRIDEAAYLQHCELVLEERERLMKFELDRFKGGLFFFLYDTPDRLQHMMWRFRDPGHPYFDGDLAPELRGRIEEHYQRCDALLAPVLDKVDEDTLLLVLSDHGFGTFRRSFDTNTWLWQNGLMALKNGSKPNPEIPDAFSEVDWSNTYAYAVGLGGIYLNFKGREKQGILDECSEAERVRSAIQKGLGGLIDDATQQVAIRSVSRREEIYSGPYLEDAPDLLVNFCRGFRVSWQSAVGGFAESLFEDNMRRWSGDHIVDPESVPGIIFVNRPMRMYGARMVDLAPTILAHLGVQAPALMEGKALI